MDWFVFIRELFSGPAGGVLLIAVLLALTLALPQARAFIREWRGKGNNSSSTIPPSGPVTKAELERVRLETARVEARIQRYDNLTDEGKRIQAHFEKAHAQANAIQILQGEVAHGGRKITAVAEELHAHREKFEQHRIEMAGFVGEQRAVNKQHGEALEAIVGGIENLKGKAG